jgi:hypothetical protein
MTRSTISGISPFFIVADVPATLSFYRDKVGSRGVSFSAPLTDSDDGLRGFRVKDIDGYGLFFGCVR